jgi:HAD superfamily hydrolase (TIGR01549 family)
MPKVLDGVKLVILDLDGVIFDIIDAIRQSAADGIEKYQLKTTIEETMADLARLIEILQATPIPKIVLDSYELLKIPALEGYSLIKRLQIALYFYARFREYKDSASIFPRIDEIIKGLADRAINVAVFTNQKASYAREVLERFNLAEFVTQIFGFNEVSKTKPDPEGILKLMEVNDIKDPQQVVYVGDMITDVEAGLAAQVKTIAVGSGLVAKEKLQDAQPTYFVNDIPELAELFEI